MTFKRPDIIRPPSEASSYFLPLTSGCSNNSCGFCNYYSSKLNIRDMDDIKNEIKALNLFMRSGLRVSDMPYIVYAIASEWDGKRIFLQDGDALAYPYPRLKEILEYLNQKFPDLERIATYATAQDVLRCSLHELQDLKRLKLGIIYMGVESGDDEILQYICKGVNSSQIIEAGKKIKDSGIISSVTVLLGLGGSEKTEEHALATANILSALDPDFAGALTLTLIPGTPLYEQNRQEKFSLISPMQSLQELRIIVNNATYTDCFFSSMHASNYLSLRGVLPRERTKMLSQLDYVISRQDVALLRPEFMRGL